MTCLLPFWAFYGGKWRAAPGYPEPQHATVVEPFAGAAGYSLRYFRRQVVLVEIDPVIAGIWDFLIHGSPAEVRRIPLVDCVDALPSWVCKPARDLVGFTLNNGASSPRRSLSSGLRKLRERGRKVVGWSEKRRARVAEQMPKIRHWRVIHGTYSDAPDIEATWFVDPPYQGRPGSHYVHGSSAIDYGDLARWCRSRRGQVTVCEAQGAAWLPFRPLGETKGGPCHRVSHEAVWTSDGAVAPETLPLF